ncbi:UNVERIFIED_CONTAM: nucleotidyltransferase family protein, partial [Salmonella enterica subsp. enterica serovar Weltevreden]
EDEPLGTAGPLQLIQNLNEDFLVMNGDILCTLDDADMVRKHLAHGGLATIGTYQKPVPINLGVLELNQEGRISDYIEKPTLS